MSAMPSRWRRMAVKMARHASWVLPGPSPWAEAMRRELDYIEDDRAALRWAIGCVMASYLARLAAPQRPRWRTVSAPALAGSMLLFTALALGHASDQTAPSLAAFEEPACDLPDMLPEIRPRLRCGTVRVPRDHARPDSGGFSLAVVVIRSQDQPSLPDPVVYI